MSTRISQLPAVTSLDGTEQVEVNQGGTSRRTTAQMVSLLAVNMYVATSTTSLTIGTGSKSLTTQAGLAYRAGTPVTLADANNPSTNTMSGAVTAYNTSTGAMTIAVTSTAGSGTIANWNLSLSGPPGPEGDQGDPGPTGSQGYSASILWAFASSTTMGDPGTGNLRFNHVTIASVTAIAVSAMSSLTGNPDISALVATWGASTSTTKATITFEKYGTPATFAGFTVTGAVTDNGTWLQIPVAYVGSNGTWSASDTMMAAQSRTGDIGSQGDPGPTGATGRDAQIQYSYSTTTTMADPGTGYFRFDNVTIASAGNIAISALSSASGNPDYSDYIVTWDDSTTTTNRGAIVFKKYGAAGTSIVAKINGSITDNGTWLQIPISVTTSTGSAANTDSFDLSWTRTGDAGAGTGDVVGPASATDNAVARFDGTTGKLIQNSTVTIADTTGDIAGTGAITPASNDGGALGSVSLSFSDLFLATGGVVNWNNGDVTITHSANTLAFAGASSGYTLDSLVTVSSSSASALAVGANGSTNPVLKVDASTASVATGISVTGAAAAGRAAVAVLSSGTNEGLSIDAKGSGTIRLGATSTGAVEFSRNAVPTSSDGAALGTTSLMWSDIFIASGGVINWDAGDVTITHSANALAIAGADSGVNISHSGAIENHVLTTTHSGNGIKWAHGNTNFIGSLGALSGGGAPFVALHAEHGTTANTLRNSGAGVKGMYVLYDGTTLEIKFNGVATAGADFSSVVTGLSMTTAGAATFASNVSATNILISSGGAVNFNSGDVTITHSANLLAFAGATSGYTFDSLATITSAGANALAVGANGTTNPVLKVDASTASVATGISVTGAAAAGRAALAVISSGTDEGLSIDAKGAGTIRLGATSTGGVEFSRNAVPTSSDGAALGTTSLMWSDLFVASGGVINFNNGNYTITHSAGDLAFSGIVTVPNTGLHLLDTDSSHDLIIAPGSNLTADRTLTITTGDASRTLTLSANFTVSNALTLAGTDSTTMTFPSTSSTVLTTGNTATITKGFTVTPYNIGTVSSGTNTPDPANGNYQYMTNNGAHTLAVPASDCAIDILVTNGASAGTITISGSYTAPSGGGGDTYATTNANKYLLMIRRINSVSTYLWKALQ